MSALLSLAAIGDMISFCRLPSRNWYSAETMNCLGWPDSEGKAGLVELPFSPWQATQVWALARPSSAPATASPAWADSRSAAAHAAAPARLDNRERDLVISCSSRDR